MAMEKRGDFVESPSVACEFFQVLVVEGHSILLLIVPHTREKGVVDAQIIYRWTVGPDDDLLNAVVAAWRFASGVSEKTHTARRPF
jgi:hypothetical protein